MTYKHIVHLSDIHIQTSGLIHENRAAEFQAVLNSLERELCNLEVSSTLIVITGDVLHTPHANVETPVIFRRLLDIVKRFEVIWIDGNHDVTGQRSQLLSMLELAGPGHGTLLHTGVYKYENITFSVLDVFTSRIEGTNHLNTNCVLPTISEEQTEEGDLRIALYHGMIEGQNFGADALPLSAFDEFDVALLGDIHTRTTLKSANDKCLIHYAGSMLQHNFGETVSGHGMTILDTSTKKLQSIDLFNPYRRIRHTYKSGQYQPYQDLLDMEPPLTKLDTVRCTVPHDLVKKAKEDSAKALIRAKMVFQPQRETTEDMTDAPSKRVPLTTREVVKHFDTKGILSDEFQSWKCTDERITQQVEQLRNYLDAGPVSREELKLETMKVENLYCFSNLTMNFKDYEDCVTAVNGRNGYGKSKLFECILFALFGTVTIPGLKVHHVARKDKPNRSPVYVKLTGSVGDDTFSILRKATTDKHTGEFTITFKDKSVLGATQAQSWITKKVGTRAEYTHTQFVMAPDYRVFTKEKEATTVLSAATNLKISEMVTCYKSISMRCNALLAQTNKAVKSHVTSGDADTATDDPKHEEIRISKQISEQRAIVEDNRVPVGLFFDRTDTELESAISDTDKKLTLTIEEYDDAKDTAKTAWYLESQRVDLVKQLEVLTRRKELSDEQVRKLSEDRNALGEHESICKTHDCTGPSIPPMYVEGLPLKNDCSGCQETKKRAVRYETAQQCNAKRPRIEREEAIKAENDRLITEMETLRGQILTTIKKRSALKVVSDDVLNTHKNLFSTRASLVSALESYDRRQKCTDATKTLMILEHSLTAVRALIEDSDDVRTLQRKVSEAKEVFDVMGAQTASKFLLQHACDAINRRLSVVPDLGLQVHIGPGKKDGDFNFMVGECTQMMPFASLSGFQKAAVSFFMLRYLADELLLTPCNVNVLDETFAVADTFNLENILRFVKENKRRGSCTFIVAHQEGAQEFADKVITMNRGIQSM